MSMPNCSGSALTLAAAVLDGAWMCAASTPFWAVMLGIGAAIDARGEALADTDSALTAGGYRPVIGAVLTLERIVEAHRLAESDHKRGNVVVTMAPA